MRASAASKPGSVINATRRTRLLLTLSLLAALLVGYSTAGAAAARVVPVPTLSTPPAGIHGHPMWDSWYDLAPFGYTQQELFVSGTATDVKGTKAAYTTRFVVFRPISAKKFNGTVMLDWTNVTAQFENAVDTMEAREMLMREGFAFVHVSAQKAGLCCTPLTPAVYDPVRYAAINHPGDQYSNDMLSQIAQAFRTPRKGGPDPMGGMRPKAILAVGQSQSASMLYDYVNEVSARDRVIDGFLIHGGGEKTFPKKLTAKVLHLLSDREANPAPPSHDPSYRLWEVAGTAHSDYFIGDQSVFGLGPRLAGLAPVSRASYQDTMDKAGTYGEKLGDPLYAVCILAGATMPMHYATSSAIYQLNRWVRTGKPAINTPRFAFSGSSQAKDVHGNPLGGLRLPPIEVPMATYNSTMCPLGGTTTPFVGPQLTGLYPTFTDYWKKMRVATDTAVRKSWLLPADAVDMMRRVCTAQTRWGSSAPCPTYRPPR
ncbi:MAG: hypothetical protein JWM40_1999 [Frankiales bacterium]|nr:hypothetical protein [Frankiales bacterium]